MENSNSFKFKVEPLLWLFTVLALINPLPSFADGIAKPAQTVQKDDLMPEGASYNKTLKNRYSLFLHKRNYLMPGTYNWRPNNDLYNDLDPQKNATNPFYEDVEAEFQISFFAPLVEDVFIEDLDFLLAYTHHAWWQLYNSSWSKPFRETNYNPELFFRKGIELKDENSFLFLDLGIMHESNGQFDVRSRSWDRVFARANFSANKFLVVLSGWYRLPEQPHVDENPGIEQYYGYGDVSVFYSMGKHTMDLRLPFAKSPGFEVGYSVPVKDFFRLYVNYKYGYGHSLIEYNRTTERIGLGFTLEGSMDRRQ